MSRCDDTFQKIQELQAQREELLGAKNTLFSVRDPGDNPPGDGPQGPREEDLSRRWLFGDQEGRTLETDFSQLDPMLRQLADGQYEDLVAGRIDARERPLGSDGQFTNFALLVDRMGIEGAQEAGELIQAITGRWEVLKPDDYSRATAINDKAAFTQRVADAYAEAGIRMDLGTISQGIAQDAAPFVSILDKQARLQVFNVVTRNNLVDQLEAMAKEIEDTGLPLGDGAKQRFMDAATKAVFAERSAALARRVSGQLLQQLKGDFVNAPGLVGKAFKEQLQREAEELFNRGSKGLITEDTLVGEIIQAAERGADGVADLRDLADTVKAEGVDPKASLEKGWKDNWRRQARGYVKDSMLLNGNTQFISNYLSNKAVYWMEGYRTGWTNGFEMLRQSRYREDIAKATGVRLPNTGTPFLMDLLQKPLQGMRVAFQAKLLTDDVIRQATRDALGDAMPTGLLADYRGKWKQVIRDGVLNGKNPFAEPKSAMEIDAAGQSMTSQQEFALANKVLFGEKGKPSSPDNLVGSAAANTWNEIKINPTELPFVLRDRVHLGFKIVANHMIEGSIKRLTGKEVRLPITPALRTLAAVDSRTGMRVFTAVRANELLMKTFWDQPDLNALPWDQRVKTVREQLDNELYSATPTDAQVKSYREQFGLPESVSDQKIRADIAAKHVGAPVLDTAERLEALEFSRYARMQTPPKLELLRKFDEGIQAARQNSYVDVVLPFWRSGASSISYVTENLTPPIVDTAKLIFNRADDVDIAKVGAAWMVWTTWTGMFLTMREGLHALTSTAPGDNKNERDQWKRRYEPNTFFGIPGLGQLPLVSVLQTMNDVADGVEAGLVSRYDQKSIYFGLFQAFTGQLYRASGFGQFRTMNDALMSQNPKQFMRALGFIANGQINPASGVLRQIERAGGLGADARYEPRWETPEDVRLRDQISAAPGFRLLQKIGELGHGIRRNLYYMQPIASNLPLKETDYLGRSLRTPEGMFVREWPTGWPGVYDSAVHNQLLAIGMLQPPAPLMNGRMGGVAMGPELEKEYNGHLGVVKGDQISSDPNFGNRLVWNKSTTVVEDGEEYTTRRSVHLGDFMDGLTEGKTLHESLNALFRSDVWKRWQQDPRLTLSPSELRDSSKRATADVPRSELLKRPGAKVVRLLHEYYGSLAEQRVMESNSQPAADWRDRRLQKLVQGGTEDQVDQEVEAVEALMP